MSMGSRLKAARVNKGYKLRKVASLTGVSPSTISKAERDLGAISAEHLNALAKCYDLSLDSIYLNAAPSFRADAATVRRAVLLADLEAMYTALTASHEVTELRTAQMLVTVAYAVRHEHSEELCEVMVDRMLGWLADAAGERDGGTR